MTPNVLTRAIAQLRKALGDDAFEARYVETVAKRGYRFIAKVAAAPTTRVAFHRWLLPITGPPARRRGSFRQSPYHHSRRGCRVGLYALGERQPPASPESQSGFSPRRFTTGSHSYSFPSISPDGRTVAYSSNQSRRDGDLHRRVHCRQQRDRDDKRRRTQHVRRVVARRTVDCVPLAQEGRIWIVPSGGGAARQVVDFGSQATWTPDGERLVFTSDAGGMAAQSIIWIVHRDGTGRRQLTKLGAPRGGHSRPSVSPDGRLVVFGVSHGHIGTEVWICIDGQRQRHKTGDGIAPHFSPDGSARVLDQPHAEGNDALMRVDIDAAGVPAGTPNTFRHFAAISSASFRSRATERRCCGCSEGSPNLWAVDVAVTAEWPRLRSPLTSDDVRNSQPRHSREGRIAFHQFAVGQPPTAWVIDEDGKNREALTVGLSVGVWGRNGRPTASGCSSPRAARSEELVRMAGYRDAAIVADAAYRPKACSASGSRRMVARSRFTS